MALTILVFAGFYPSARHTIRYADALAQSVGARLVLLHLNPAAPNDLVARGSYQQEPPPATAALLYQEASGLRTAATVEVVPDLRPAVVQDLARRYQPALFVLSQPRSAYPPVADLVSSCAEILQAGGYPLLVVPGTAATADPARRILVAADQEPFTLAEAARALYPLLHRPGITLTVAHVSSRAAGEADCMQAARAVQASGLVDAVPISALRGYEHAHRDQGLLVAVQDTQADLMLVLARQRSYLSNLFRRSVTAWLLRRCPVPVLVLPTGAAAPRAAEPISHFSSLTTAAQYANVLLTGLSPAS